MFSKKFILFLENEIDKSDNSREYVRFQNFVDKIQKESQKKGNLKSAETSSNFDDEFLHIFSTTQDKVVVSISCNQPSQEIQTQMPNIAVLSQQQKPNYHWLVVNLAILHPNKVTVNCFDFQTNDEIRAFFDDIFKIPRQLSVISIFDRQTADFTHNRFDTIRISKTVHYFTFAHKFIFQDLDKIKDFFKKAKVFTTKTKKITHGRRILFENFVVISDNDFNSLNVGEDWNIDIQYSEKDFQDWLSRIDKYRENK